jgi:preprotein translocase subunit SecG
MSDFFHVIHVLAALGLIGLVLLQHGKGADAGAAFGSGASSTVFGSRGAGSFLSRTTAILAATFFCTSLVLAYFNTHQNAEPVTSVVKEQPAPKQESSDLPNLGSKPAETPKVEQPKIDVQTQPVQPPISQAPAPVQQPLAPIVEQNQVIAQPPAAPQVTQPVVEQVPVQQSPAPIVEQNQVVAQPPAAPQVTQPVVEQVPVQQSPAPIVEQNQVVAPPMVQQMPPQSQMPAQSIPSMQ